MNDGFSFHAAPRAGEWFNDPNGLVFADGRYRMFMQHSCEGPGFRKIGWGVSSSNDLLAWQWDSVAIPFKDDMSAYSGSITQAAPLEAFLTRHRVTDGIARQDQWRATADERGKWSFDEVPLGPQGRNVRDPFVFEWAATGDWRMLLAEPCDWTSWAQEEPSVISVWASPDKRDWRRVGTIGPWNDPGIMWEVPVLLDFGDAQVLLISTVDRRGDAARSGVRAYAGRFDGACFVAADNGHSLDLGPDFYAACVNTVAGWPDAGRVLVGWASSWATARFMPWPGDVGGGPISLPRVVGLNGGRLALAPLPASIARAARIDTWRKGELYGLWVKGDEVTFVLTIDAGGVLAGERRAKDARLDWQLATSEPLVEDTTITVFCDHGLVEVFFAPQGLAMTVFVPGGEIVEGTGT